MKLISRLKGTPARRPQLALLATFAVAVLLGTLLLLLPIAQNSAVPRLSVIDTLFTATSATCVTGLTLVETSTQFTLFGQAVILCLIQIGGLGIMTFAAFFMTLAGRRLSANNETALAKSVGGEENRSLRSLISNTIKFTFIIEGVGAFILARSFINLGYSTWRSAYYGIFHSVSVFCNAGFSLFPGSAMMFGSNICVLLSLLVIMWLGGIGFLVMGNLVSIRLWDRNLKTRGRLKLHTKMALWASLVLMLIGTISFLCFEWNHSLAKLDLISKIVVSIFHSITSRTTGLNAVDMNALSVPSRFMTMALMFIGGSPGATAGGIKTTTAVVMLLTMIAAIRGRSVTTAGTRVIPESVVRQAFTICLLTILFIALAFGGLLLTEAPQPGSDTADRILFETISAFATCGLSLGISPELSPAGRIIIICAMYIGRLGPLTIALSIGRAGRVTQRLRYPDEEVVVG